MNTILREIIDWVLTIGAAFIIVLLVQSLLFTLIRVDGGSMNPTLLNNERLFVTVYDAKFGSVNRGDIVICRYPNRGLTNFVKRVVAVPGDKVYRTAGVTHVIYTENGHEVDVALDLVNPPAYSLYGNDYEPYILGAEEYFVVGDNRSGSHDSRDWNDNDSSRDVGPITRDMITGHVRSVFWPLNKIRIVE